MAPVVTVTDVAAVVAERGNMLRRTGMRTATTVRGTTARRTRLLALRLAGALAASSLVAVGVLTPAPSAIAAQAADYPSWEEVLQAQRAESSAKALQRQLEASLSSLQAEVDRTNAELEEKGRIYAEAQEAYDEQAYITEQLAQQAAAAQEQADEAKTTAARLLAEMSKQGSNDMTAQLLTEPGSPDGMLYRLETARILTERYDDLYDEALRLQNTADSLADQAQVAQDRLAELKILAEEAFEAAQAAQRAAQDELDQAQSDIARLEAQIAVLAEQRAATIEDYNAGIRAQWGSGAEGQISASGWARPVAGYISSGYGWRIHPISGASAFHNGTDVAGQGCGASIRAAHGGTVTYAGYNGGLGYYVQIDHGNGTSSGYAHIMAGGIGVRVGQTVGPGQQIARVGTTGYSTGCHLHFIIRVNGNTTDPVSYLRNQGITLG